MNEPVNNGQGSRPVVRIAEVAKCAGVSAATVSRILNGKGKCSAETRERVLEVIHDLGYLPNLNARPVAQGRMGVLGVLLPNMHTEFMSSLARGMASAAMEASYDLLMAVRPEGSGKRLLGRFNADGVLVFHNYLTEPDFDLLVAERCPAVLMYRRPPNGVDVPCILVDNTPGVYAAVSHLITEHGRRRIVFLRGPYKCEDSVMRENGYRQALIHHGIGVDRTLIRSGSQASLAHAATLELMREGVEFDAIVGWCDDAAVGAMDALRASGKSVGPDVSVVGFDNVQMINSPHPPLTTIDAATENVGRTAVRQLVSLLEQGTASPLERVPTELVIRKSCGCGGS